MISYLVYSSGSAHFWRAYFIQHTYASDLFHISVNLAPQTTVRNLGTYTLNLQIFPKQTSPP